MHYKNIVLLKKEELNTDEPNEIKDRAVEEFEQHMQPDFIDYDWYVIGGRWSGYLLPEDERPDFKTLDQHKKEGYNPDVQEVTEYIYNEHLREYEGLNNTRLGSKWYARRATNHEMQHTEPYFNVHVLHPSYEEISKENVVGNYYAVIFDYHS